MKSTWRQSRASAGGLAAARQQRVQRGPQRRGLLPDLGPHRGGLGHARPPAERTVLKAAKTASRVHPLTLDPGRGGPQVIIEPHQVGGGTGGEAAQVRPADQVGGDPGRGGHRRGQAAPAAPCWPPPGRSAAPIRPAPPSARRGGTPAPGGSVIGSPPSRYSPGGMPAHAAASVTRQIRPGAAANASVQLAVATWWGSTIRPLVSRGSASAWPTTPGSRDFTAGLRVEQVGDHPRPGPGGRGHLGRGGVAVPHADQHARPGQLADGGQPPGHLGGQGDQPDQARPRGQQLIQRGGLWRHDPVRVVRAAAARRDERPFQVHAEHPRASPAPRRADIPLTHPRASASCRTGAVMKVGRNAVQPVAGSRSMTVAQPAGSAACISTPKYPLTWRSTSPGTSTPASSSRSGGPGGRSWPTSVIRSPAVTTYPGSSTGASGSAVMTRGAVMITSGGATCSSHGRRGP